MSAKDSVAGALERFGRAMVLRREISDGDGGVTRTDVTIKATKDGATPDPGAKVQFNAVVKFTPARLVAANWPMPPKRGDFIVCDGQTITIQAVDTKVLGDDIIAYFCNTLG